MNSSRIFKRLFLSLTLLVSIQGFAQLSKTHYIPPLTSAEFGNANPEEQYIYISTPSAANINYTIMPVGQPVASYITGVVSNANPQEIFLGTGNGQLFIPSPQTSTVVNDRGYIIEAEGTVYVSVRMNAGSGAQAGALVSKGLAALGTTFRVGSYTNENPQDNYLNFVSVMATEDNTQVTFSDLDAGLIIKNYTGVTPIVVNLNEGESYTIATNSNDSVINQDGLIGALVNSDKPIVVNCGSTNGSFGGGNGRDYGIDQIVGLSKVGTEYIFVRGDGSDVWENILIVAHSDNTTISINGNAPISTINAGEFYVIEGNFYSGIGNMYVETSQPVFAYQGVGGLGNNGSPNEANQGMFFVPPLSCETRGNLDNIANIQSIGGRVFSGGVSIVTKVGATVTINNLPLNNFNTTGPSPVTGKTDYITYKVLGLSGNVSVQSSDELYCAYFNYDGSATSGSFYSGFPSPPEINFDALFATLGVCIPNVTLEVANAGSFDSFEWFFDDGSGGGFTTTGNTALQYTPNLSGTYKLIGTLNCTNTTLESLEVPVSICPDDIDNDGVPDNTDIDNDNDGILNCTESNGNQNINLSNPTSGSIPVGSYTYTGSINTIGTKATTPLVGTTDGTFMSETPSRNNTAEVSVTYALVFNNNLNLLFEYASSSALGSGLLTNDEEFIIRVPNTKTITLLDPDDQLLVDTNFDGVYETGITQISAFEIRFKLNGTSLALGTGTFSFSANSVNAITYIHKNTSDTSSNQATFKLTATCVANDNDFDGIEDALDLDSDNDGIPDFVENIGILRPLSGVDADLNGLDDIYDIAGIPLDTDADTVPDFYDLDSDNDGITDLIETGQLGLLSDTDLNGIVDSGFPFGINGWVDLAETTPDSNLIGYTLNDFDLDTIFSYMDSDSDGDGCSDVIEAGFSDANGDNYLGNGIVVVDLTPDSNTGQGLVTNASDGYTIPNSDYLDFAPITITTQPVDTEVCESSSQIISVISADAETYQWELSTDGTTWNPIADDAIYSGSQTTALTISNTPLAFNNFQYRVKLDRSGNSCSLYSDEIELTVNPLPIINSPVILIQCDDDDLTTLGFSFFNLTEANNEISANAANETFTYFLTQAAASFGDITSPDFINNPTTFENRTISSDVVWARIESAFGCGIVSEIQLNVSTTVIPSNFLVTFNQCDDFLDINGVDNANNDNRDGVATFDFSSIDATVLSFIPVGQNPLPPRYFRNEADALAEINEITDISNYRNIGYPNSQFIYVRVDSNIANDCLGLGAHILLNVEPLPVANPISITRQCDDDNDGEFPFDTSQVERDLLGAQNPTDVTVEYFDEIGNPLPSPLPNPFLTASQTISIRVTNNTTSAPDGPCFDETTLEFIVDVSPVANPVTPFVVCDGDSGDIDDDGLYPFNTSNIESTVLGSQTIMDIFYTYIDETGSLISNATSLPNPLISGSQTITVDVINPLNAVCAASTTIDFVVNPLPGFSIETPQIVCSSDPNFTIVLDPLEDNSTETYTYEWVNDTGISLSTDETLTVSTPGTYFIILTKTDGTGCSRTRDVFVNASELATITQDDITIIDISDNNTITINETNLGLGDYEYALDDEFSSYQDEPFFDRIKGGIHTLFVRDKNGCGTTSIDISVIDYPNFFTPNGDGFNDSWQILGINAQFQPQSDIYIFNRYGKLLKQLNPLSNGWDGTFNGNMMNSDDYWFKVSLQDGREFKGHFSLKR
tara:strand:- start:10977 stop:16139 length:5163 start_codon:yes stop_codon:yes gene_type:complete